MKSRSIMKNKKMRRFLGLFLTFSIIVSLESVVTVSAFSDVAANHWAYSAVNYVSKNEYMVGTGNNQFTPNGVLTRAEIITTLYKVAEAEEPTNTQPYSDVSQNSYYYNPVRWAYHNMLSQIIQTNATTFSPTSSVSRVKIAELIWKLAQFKGWTSSSAPSVTLPYTDIGSLTTAQKNALKWCYYNSIMVGMSGTAFSPNSTVTRAQLAVIIYALDNFASKGKAYCVGTNYNDDDHINTTRDATTARDCYSNMGYNVTCLTIPTEATMKYKHNLKSKIIFLSGHGNQDGMYFNYMQMDNGYKTGVCDGDSRTINGYRCVSILGNMDFVDLAVFAGCKTAQGTSNIARSAHDYGAKISMGWSDSVYAYDHSNWLERFNQKLAAGKSVDEAAEYADMFGYFPGANVRDHVEYALPADLQRSLVLNGSQASSTFEMEAAPRNMIEDYNGDVIIDRQNILEELAAFIKKSDNSFNIEDYRVYTHENGAERTTIDLIRVIGGFETNSEFTAILNGNKLVSLYDKSKELSKEESESIIKLSNRLGISRNCESEQSIAILHENTEKMQNAPKELVEALRVALEKTQASPQKEAVRQRYHYYYDMESKKTCILVYTEYLFDGTDTMGVDFHVYDLMV